MAHKANLNTAAKWSKDVEHLLPKITSLIIEGIQSDQMVSETQLKLFKKTKNRRFNRRIHQFSLPQINSLKEETPIKRLSEEVYPGREVSITHFPNPKHSVRPLIGGISHSFNNLLMGLWGYTTLIARSLEKDHRAHTPLEHIEGLIQNGSNLMHLLFGYIIERRTIAKKLRLQQLIIEINNYNEINVNGIDLALVENSLIRLSKMQNKVQLAGCIASVMNQILILVKQKRQLIEEKALSSANVSEYLDKIDRLLNRGFHMIQRLEFYAETKKPKFKKVCLTSIARQLFDSIDKNGPGISITREYSASLPILNVDPEQITYALKQVMDNAIDAVALDGNIHIQLDTVNSEDPKERCGVHAIHNYTVVTVTDSGKGMTIPVQAQIFEPFFTTYRFQGRTGLGLAAAAGIIKSHGGYMQVRSRQGVGSSIKIYLPESRLL